MSNRPFYKLPEFIDNIPRSVLMSLRNALTMSLVIAISSCGKHESKKSTNVVPNVDAPAEDNENQSGAGHPRGDKPSTNKAADDKAAAEKAAAEKAAAEKAAAEKAAAEKAAAEKAAADKVMLDLKF